MRTTMQNLGKAALATVTAAAAAAATLTVAAGAAEAAPRYTQYAPTLISGTSSTGAWWQGFLLNRAQTRKFHNEGTWTLNPFWDPAAYNTEMAKAFNPKRGGTGCIVALTLVRPRGGATAPATGPNFIRDAGYAARKPDQPNAMYWSTANFRCV
ncbi:MAG: hypothetical protein QM728_08185 [Gordonia sp. (in: high G+C Gram-positive bacteria)]|uniref:hypothetical protein n=1 Tax=Gordonia sp. (in: high G+C Gram-positive bacteria) TaxID=84139 RepID=UPI0039E6BAF6